MKADCERVGCCLSCDYGQRLETVKCVVCMNKGCERYTHIIKCQACCEPSGLDCKSWRGRNGNETRLTQGVENGSQG